MPACATHKETTDHTYSGNLILPVPDTDFRNYLDEVAELVRFAPEIVGKIEEDLESRARKKKRLRLEDQKFFEARTDDLPELDIAESDLVTEDLSIAVGRPRMSAYAVYVFMMLRSFLGSLSSKTAQRFLLESMSLSDFLQCRELKMPGCTTMVENVNAVSHATREFIMDKQIELVLKEGLDDCRESTIDSTSGEGQQQLAHRRKGSPRSAGACASPGSATRCLRTEELPQGMYPALAQQDGRVGVSNLPECG